MGIALNVDTYLLCSMFNINVKKLTTEYSGMSIEEIMETEAKQGNDAAAKFDAAVLSDPVKLMELFELKDPSNKYAILSNMNEQDLENLLPLLSQQDLITGLNFFTKTKILDLVQNIPGEQLVNFTMQMFSPEHLMALMPVEQLNNVLNSTQIDKRQEMKLLETLPPEILAQMIEVATGEPAPGAENVGLDGKPKYDTKQLVGFIQGMENDTFQEAMLGIPPAHKQEFVLKLAQQNPNLYLEIDPKAYTDIIGQKKQKDEMLRAATAIDNEQLIGMIETLPKDLTAVVLTQIDPSKFAEKLLANFKGILREIVAA